jgi:hypothetical protein
MASVPLKLDNLPSEIIKRFAACSPCESVLALLKTNRRLYQECNDHMVFKGIIRNGNGLDIMPLWDTGFLSGNTSASDCARFALADSMVRKWVAKVRHQDQEENEDSNEDDDLHDMINWAPQLVALHHPFIADTKLYATELDAQLKEGAKFWEDNLAGLAGMNFCVTANILNYGISTVMDRHPWLGITLPPQIGHVRKYLLENSEMADELPVTAVLSCLLIQKFPTKSSLSLLPRPTNIPFSSFTDFPLPFSGNPFRNPEKGYLRAMTSKSFLEDGEWIGYYNYSPRLGHCRFHPPMTGIHLTTSTVEPEKEEATERHIEESSDDKPQDADNLALTTESKDEEQILEVKASGTDSVENFTLSGQIRSNGRIDIKKTDATGLSWDWNAWMTPFGMVGFWGRGQADYGYIWLWKKSWTTYQR